MYQKFHSAVIGMAAVLLLLNLAACVSMPKHISESGIPHDEWPIELYQPTEDLVFIRSDLSMGSPGLIAAVIDGARNSSAKNAYTSVLDFAERNSLNDLFLGRIQDSGILKRLSRDGEIIGSDTFDSSGLETGFIRVDAVVQLTHDLSTLLVTLEFKEYTRSSISFRTNGIRQVYHYAYRLDGFDEEKSRSEFADQWVALGEEKFVEIVEAGIDEVLEMMNAYFSNPNPALHSEEELYVEGYRQMSWRSRVWGGSEEVVWLIRGNAQQFVFATPRDFVAEADWDQVLAD